MVGPEAPLSRAMAGNLAPLGLQGLLDIKSSHTCTRFVKEAAFFAPVRVILAHDSW